MTQLLSANVRGRAQDPYLLDLGVGGAAEDGEAGQQETLAVLGLGDEPGQPHGDAGQRVGRCRRRAREVYSASVIGTAPSTLAPTGG